MKYFKIQKLFGRFDYDITLSPDGLTILTGPNGFGKSTILRCIEAISIGNIKEMEFLFSLNFKNIFIGFEDNSETIISKSEKKININGSSIPIEKLKFDTFNKKKFLEYYQVIRDLDMDDNEIVIRDETPFHFSFETPKNNEPIKKFKLELLKLKEKVGQIYFIQEQRLIKRNNDTNRPIVNVIEQLPNNFKKLINSISSNYSSISNQLDSTYPMRLFNTEEGITIEEFEKKIFIMNEKFDKLNKYNLSSMKKLDNVIFKKEDAKALKIYFDDFEEKYEVYEDFINRLDLFTNIIGDRLSFKKVIISKDNGISIVNAEAPYSEIPLDKLSSGEKQEIVLFYELIFETPKNQLLLIDEPEISLHISWQKKFMDDLLEIIKYKSLNVIVATHSPQIINNHWERQIDLGSLYGIQLDKAKSK